MFVYNATKVPTHRELVNLYQAALNQRIAAGKIQPLVFPYHALGGIALFVYLCIPHTKRPWLHALRWPLAAAIIAFDLNIIVEVRSMFAGTGFGVGLAAAFGIVWTLTWLVWNDPQFDAKRVERIPGAETVVKANKEGSGLAVSNGRATEAGEGSRQKKRQNGHATTSLPKKSAQNEEGSAVLKQEGKAIIKYYWQSYPVDSLWARMDWVTDLLLNLRGTGWNHEISSNPPLPASVRAGLGEPIDLASMSLKATSGIKRYPSRASLFRASIPRFIIGYLFLDVLKTFLPYDPYFMLGPEIASQLPLPWPISNFSPVYLLIYRELVTLVAIITALETIFRLAPLIECLLFGPRWLGTRGEHWQYPTTWGPDLSRIYSSGLVGLWGSWWHQTFRLAFSAPTSFFIRQGLLAPKSPNAQLSGLLVAFVTSGFLHASGSTTQFPSTIPLNPFLFFLLQAVGILIQQSFTQFFSNPISKLPQDIRQNCLFAWTFTWLFCTSPLLIDDFARGGLWLFQVVPVSLLRGLGAGGVDDGWWSWGDVRSEFSWHVGRHWWESGIRV